MRSLVLIFLAAAGTLQPAVSFNFSWTPSISTGYYFLHTTVDFFSSKREIHKPIAHGDEKSNAVGIHMPNTTAGPLLTLWINLDRSRRRRIAMENMFRNIDVSHRGSLNPVRVSAVNVMQVDSLLSNAHLVTIGTKLIDRFEKNRQNWQHHFSGEYVKTEAGCVLSHLFAIKDAYNRGEEVALIIEDDAVVTDKLLLNWRNFVSLAPTDWQVLQLYSNNAAIMKLAARVKGDGFIPWMPDHFGTAAYFINRAGMKTILDLTHSDNTTWTFPDKMVVADELIYYYTATYTVIDPMIYISNANSTIQKDTSDELDTRVRLSKIAYDSRLDLPYNKMPAVNVSAPQILILTTTMILNLNKSKATMDLFFTNIGIITKHVNVQYDLLILCRSDEIKESVLEAAKPYLVQYGKVVNIHLKIQQHRFNKFRFVQQFIGIMGRFDSVFIVDSDMLFSGFPWAEFFKRQHESKAVITGTVRESKSEGLIRNVHPGVRQWFRVFDGSWWKRPENQEKDFVYTDFIEQYFSFMDGKFAQWYFNQILTDVILQDKPGVPSQSDFGIDVMWCGAAAEWLNVTNNTMYTHACALSPLVITHADTRQITFYDGSMDKEHLRKMDAIFPVWSDYSYKFRSVLGGKRWSAVNMTAVIYQYAGYTPSMLASMGFSVKRRPYKVIKRKRKRKKVNATNTTAVAIAT